MKVPSVEVMSAATRDVARAVGRSVPFNRDTVIRYLSRLAADSASCLDLDALLAIAVRLSVELRVAGGDLVCEVRLAVLATFTANDVPLSPVQHQALTDVPVTLPPTDYVTACIDLVTTWTRPFEDDVLPEPANAVILTARTGHPRHRLQDLDELSTAVGRVLASKKIIVQELALGETNPRPPVDIDSGDRAAIDDADLVIAALQPPSVGVGLSLGYACRHAPVIILLNQRGAPMPPLGIGMPWDTEIVEFEPRDPAEAVAGVDEVVRRRTPGILDCRDRRIARDARWQALSLGVPGITGLPDWFPSRRLEELRARPGRAATASVEELDALCRVLGLPWRALSPHAAELEISETELRTVLRAADIRKWSPQVVEKIVFSVNDTRSASLGRPMAERADIVLDNVQDIVLYAIHNRIVDRDAT